MAYGELSLADDLAAYPKWSSTTLTWGLIGSLPSFYSSSPNSLVPYLDTASMQPSYSSVFDNTSLNVAEQNAALYAFSAISHFSNLVVVKTTDGDPGTINFGTLTSSYVSHDGERAWGSPGDDDALGDRAGDIWLTDAARIGATGTGADDVGFYIISHEIGHVIGLKHAYEIFPNLSGTEQYNNQKFQ